jgi:hypothetical protein
MNGGGQNIMQNQTVRLHSALGVIERVVVEDLGEILAVCREDELNNAIAEGRKPATVGFRKTSIVPFDVDKSVCTKHNGQYESPSTKQANPSSFRSRRGK